MAHTFHVTTGTGIPTRALATQARNATVRHSRGVSLANRAAGPHHYRDETDADGGKTALRRRVRRTGRQALAREIHAQLAA